MNDTLNQPTEDTPPLPADAPVRQESRPRIAYLVTGLLFLGLAVLWLLLVTGVVAGNGLAVLAPALLILVGVVGLAASLARSRTTT